MVVEGVLRRGDGDRLSVYINLPLVGVVDAGEHVHQGSFTAAVLAQQRQDLALVQLQIDGVVGHHRTEALCDVFHFNGA